MVVCKDSLWVKVCKAKYGVLEVLSTLSQNTKSSIWWKDMLKSSVLFKCGGGERLFFNFVDFVGYSRLILLGFLV